MQLRSHPSSSFLGLLACVQTPPPLQKSRIERFFFFFKGGGGCTQARHPGPIRYGFSLLRVTEDEVLCRMQADALKIFACDCTSHPINLWRPVSSVVTERKGSRHLCHLSNPPQSPKSSNHPSHPSHPGRQRQPYKSPLSLQSPKSRQSPKSPLSCQSPNSQFGSLPRFKRQY